MGPSSGGWLIRPSRSMNATRQPRLRCPGVKHVVSSALGKGTENPDEPGVAEPASSRGEARSESLALSMFASARSAGDAIVGQLRVAFVCLTRRMINCDHAALPRQRLLWPCLPVAVFTDVKKHLLY